MFTVKHVKSNGEEFMMECASFFADRVEGCMTLRFRTFETPYVNDDFIMMWVGEPRSRSLDYDAIYVMNRFGATVATHYFVDGSRDGCFEANMDTAQRKVAA